MPKKNILPAAPVKSAPPISFTQADLFIIESLRLKDEQAQLFEGKVMSNILAMCGKKPIYYYFRTPDELVMLADEFRQSGYRYLHLSCHGHQQGIETTLGLVSADRFSDIFADKLKNRRLFISACSIGKGQMPELVRDKNKGMYSIVSPLDDIRLNRAAGIWAAFYLRMFESSAQHTGVDGQGKPSSKLLKNEEIRKSLVHLCRLFDVRFKWSYHNAKHDEWVDEVIPEPVRLRR
jgi:hypothetical protein